MCSFLPRSCPAWPRGLLWPAGFGGSAGGPFQSPGLKGHGMLPLVLEENTLDGHGRSILDPEQIRPTACRSEPAKPRG